jgi:hypothetical protein
MTQLHAIGDTLERLRRLLDVVFVHGAGGHYLNSWGLRRELQGGEKDSMLYWLLADPELKDIGVWSLQHESDKFWGGRQGSLVRAELLNNMLVEMIQASAFVEASPGLPRRPICWVAHSEGGNLVKQFLQYCQLQRAGNLKRAMVAAAILDATQATYFIDTPHRGSWVARLRLLGLRRRVRELREADSNLIRLDQWFVDSMDGKIQSLNFHQAGERFKVVGTASVLLQRAENIAIDRNHNQIAAPAKFNDPPYRQIKSDVLRIHADIQQQSLPAPGAPLLVQRGAIAFEAEPPRLICFVELVPGPHPPGTAGVRQANRFRVRFWLSQGDESPPEELKDPKGHKDPKEPNDPWIEAQTYHQLWDSIVNVYADQLGPAQGGRLLLALFLPHEHLISDRLPIFLNDLRCSAKACLPNCTGIPILLACSSRWSVEGSAHSKLRNTRADVRKASDRLNRILFADSSSGKASLGCLDWLMIEDSSPAMPLGPNSDQPRMQRPSKFGSVVERAQVFGQQTRASAGAGAGDPDGPADPDEAIDILADRHAIYLGETGQGGYGQSDLNPFDPLLMRGIPLIWYQKSQPSVEVTPSSPGSHSSHPMDSILAWDGLTFLAYFYRYQSERPAEADAPYLPLRRFIRQGIIFWEDVRHIPTEASLRTGAASVPPTRWKAPLQ